MKRNIALVVGLGLAIATVAFAGIGSADHGPFCQTRACCEVYETGSELAQCKNCVGLLGLNAWDTHGNQCYAG